MKRPAPYINNKVKKFNQRVTTLPLKQHTNMSESANPSLNFSLDNAEASFTQII